MRASLSGSAFFDRKITQQRPCLSCFKKALKSEHAVADAVATAMRAHRRTLDVLVVGIDVVSVPEPDVGVVAQRVEAVLRRAQAAAGAAINRRMRHVCVQACVHVGMHACIWRGCRCGEHGHAGMTGVSMQAWQAWGTCGQLSCAICEMQRCVDGTDFVAHDVC